MHQRLFARIPLNLSLREFVIRCVPACAALLLVFGCDAANTKGRGEPTEPIATGWTPPTGAQTSGNCSIRIARLDDREMETTVAEFHRRNHPAKWEVTVDPFSGQIILAYRRHFGVRPDVDHKEIAQRFVRRNADLLGLSRADLTGLRWELASGPHSTTEVTAIPQAPRDRPELMRRRTMWGWNGEVVRVRVAPDGEVVEVIRPRFWGLPDPRCEAAKVSEAEAKKAEADKKADK